MDVGVRSSNDIYDPIGLVTQGVPQNRRRKVVTLISFFPCFLCIQIMACKTSEANFGANDILGLCEFCTQT
jgi:hypothetical protein